MVEVVLVLILYEYTSCVLYALSGGTVTSMMMHKNANVTDNTGEFQLETEYLELYMLLHITLFCVDKTRLLFITLFITVSLNRRIIFIFSTTI